MKILIVNDDGIQSKKIYALKKILELYAHVYICVPNCEKSGSSHSTNKKNIIPENLSKEEIEDVYTHSGTASDSVAFFLKYVTQDIDFVISGINEGYNLGLDIVYSGTVGAALEANIHGIRSIAISAKKNCTNFFSELPRLFNWLFYQFDWKSIHCLNINFPDQPTENDIYKYRFTSVAQIAKPLSGNNDYNLCRNHKFVTITPLQSDFTDKEALKNINEEEKFYAKKEESFILDTDFNWNNDHNSL